MSDEKDRDALGTGLGGGDQQPTAASRARNKTVMLSPEMTGQVRAMLQDDEELVEEAAPAQAEQAAEGPLGGTYIPPVSEWQGVNEVPGGVPNGAEPAVANRATSILDANAISAMESAIRQDSGDIGEPQGFDPLTSVVPSMVFDAQSSEPQIGQEVSPIAPEPMPEPAVEQALGGFSAGAPTAPTGGGAPRAPQAPAAPAAGPDNWHTVQSKGNAGKLVGFFVSYDKFEDGEIFEIRTGRFLLTSRPTDNGDYLLVDDETISPLHAIIRATDVGKIQVLDQLSEFGTALKKAGEEEEEEVAGGLATVDHGDQVRFGKRHFIVVSIPQVDLGGKD